MKSALKLIGLVLAVLLIVVGASLAWYVQTKQPVREGKIGLRRLQAPVTVNYDERGVPHIRAANEPDVYRALGYVHAQDRLFQMEMVRRLARGELAEILGPKLLDTDRLFRTLGLRLHAEQVVARMDMTTPSSQALLAYLDGINQYQDRHRSPMEFDILGIPKRVFTPQDTVAVSGYLAYSFAMAFKTEPVLTHIRDKLGPQYLKVFDIDWQPEAAPSQAAPILGSGDWQALNQLAQVNQDALSMAGIPRFEGSNAWAVSGRRTASGKPMLAGDPHIDFSVPSVWYEAHLSAPNFDLYGHYQALSPMALLGHNAKFGWSLSMFQNDDMDLAAEKPNPANANQVWYKDQWVDLQTRTEAIMVKGAAPVQLTLRNSPHGPIITDAFPENYGKTPIAMWWAFLETENPLLEAFYDLNRANTRDKAREAARKIHAPGLNVVWANAAGDIGWWAAAKLPIRPKGVNPGFILDASKGEAEKLGYYYFNFNPQEENPPRGYIVSANQQPSKGVPVAGYYNLSDRAQRLDTLLSDPERQWDTAAMQELQLDLSTDYSFNMLAELMPILTAVVTDSNEKAFLEPLDKWDGAYSRDSIAATIFSQLLYELAKAAMQDELGEVQFNNLLNTRALDAALEQLVADPKSPWWDNVKTKAKESHFETVRIAWHNALEHLQGLHGSSLLSWSWGQSHTLTHMHPLGRQKPLNLLFNVGPFPVPGGREVPNNLSGNIGPAPWAVRSGPSTRRVIDFGNPGQSVGINPVGQSGVLFDTHYADQAARFAEGIYAPQYLSAKDVLAHTKSTLMLLPGR